MKVFWKSCLLLVVLGMVMTCSTHANAQTGCGWGYYLDGGLRGHANQKTIPYFALHPPVYYSHPVARPFGFTPFAVPPGVMPMEMKVSPQLKVMVNPHYRPKKQNSKKTSNRVAGGELIVNPFYRPREGNKLPSCLVGGQ